MKNWKYINGAEIGNANPGQKVKVDFNWIGVTPRVEEVKVIRKRPAMAGKWDPNPGYEIEVELPNGKTYWVHENAVVGNASYKGAKPNYNGVSDSELKSWLRMAEQDLREAKRDMEKANRDYRGAEVQERDRAVGKYSEQADEANRLIYNITEELKEREQKKRGNSKVGNADPRIASLKAKIKQAPYKDDKGTLKDVYSLADSMVKDLEGRRRQLLDEAHKIEVDLDGWLDLKNELKWMI